MAARLTEIAIDCQDHVLVGDFWAAVLGYDVVDHSDGPKAEGTGTAGQDRPCCWARTPDGPRTTKNRVHLDVNPTDRDQDAEVERILALGATRVDIGQGEAELGGAGRPRGQRVLRAAVPGRGLVSRGATAGAGPRRPAPAGGALRCSRPTSRTR